MRATFTWANKTGNLPDIPVDSIIVNHNDPAQVFAGTDWGVYYTDDITLPGQLWASLVRSPMAHAKIVSIDKSAALAMPGVIAVYGPKDLAHYAKDAYDIEYEMPFGWQEFEGIHNRTDFDLNRQAMRIPAGLALDLESAHGFVARNDVF